MTIMIKYSVHGLGHPTACTLLVDTSSFEVGEALYT